VNECKPLMMGMSPLARGAPSGSAAASAAATGTGAGAGGPGSGPSSSSASTSAPAGTHRRDPGIYHHGAGAGDGAAGGGGGAPPEAGAYTRSLFSSTSALSDTQKHPEHPLSTP